MTIDDPELIEVISKLGQGYKIRTHMDGHDTWMTLEPPDAGREIRDSIASDLGRLGFLQNFPGGYELSDKGRKAYLKSTDEMGDGKIHVETKP